MDLPVNIYDPVSLRTSRAGCRACSAPARLPQASMGETGGPGRSPRLLWEQAEGTTIASLGHLDPAGCGYSHTTPRQPAIAAANASSAARSFVVFAHVRSNSTNSRRIRQTGKSKGVGGYKS